MRETLNITTFDKGIIAAPDQEDIALGACVASTNIDGEVETGKLRGIDKVSSVSASYGLNIRKGAFLRDGSTYDFIGEDSNNNYIVALTDFYGTLGSSNLVTSNVSAATCFTAHNRAVHVGTGNGSANVPKWIGHIDYGQFGNSAPSGIQTQNAALTTSQGTSNGQFGIGLTNTQNAGDANFLPGHYYQWKFSLVYDGYQESPLSTYVQAYVDEEVESYDVVITCYGAHSSASSFNPRVSAVNIYRAESDNGLESGLGLFRLIKTFDITAAGTTSGNNRTFTYTDDNSFSEPGAGITYEANSGMPETLTTSIVNYALSTAIEGYHFVAKCYHASIPDAANYIFRSKELRFDMFDWTNDLVRLPEIPTAIIGYEGRLYAFSENKVYRIDPVNLIIEDIFEGAGARSDRSVCVTPYGLFFANSNDAYRLFNNEISIISEVIRVSSSGNASWQTMAFGTQYPIAIYDAKKSYVLFLTSSSSKLRAWAFHIIKNRWDYWTFDDEVATTQTSGAFAGKDGEIYFSNGSALLKLYGTTNAQYGWSWTSGEIGFGNNSQKKQLNKIITNGTGTPTIKYGTDGGTVTTNTATSDSYINSYIKTLQLQVSGATTVEVDNIAIVFRRMVGER
jgi:hypothetical protein